MSSMAILEKSSTLALPDCSICSLAEVSSTSALASQLCEQNRQWLRSHLVDTGLLRVLFLDCKLLW